MAIAKAYKFPKAIGACADLLYQLKAKRLAGQKLVNEVEEEEKALKAYIINTLPKSESSGVAGKIARVTVVTKQVPQLADDDKFYAYIAKTKRFDLLTKRLSTAAIEELWEAGTEVPGIDHFQVVTISLNKL